MRSKGFTVVEIIVVMAIIGVLTGLGGMKYVENIQEGRNLAVQVGVKTLEGGATQYQLNKGELPSIGGSISTEDMNSYVQEGYANGRWGYRFKDGEFYKIDYEKLSNLVDKPEKAERYYIHKPSGSVMYIRKVTEEGSQKLGISREDGRNIRVKPPVVDPPVVDPPVVDDPTKPVLLPYKYGANIEAYYTESVNRLTLTGTGAMYDFTESTRPDISEFDGVSLHISDGITTVGSYAFFGTTISAVYLGADISEIREGSFATSEITKVNIKNTANVTIIGNNAFNTCRLESVKFLAKMPYLSTIEDSAFNANTILDFDMREILPSLDYLGAHAFANNSLRGTLTLRDIEIGDRAFEGNPAITAICIEGDAGRSEGVTLGRNILGESKSTKVLRCNDVQKIPTETFVGLSLEEVHLEGVGKVENAAFKGQNLTRLTLVDVEELGANAFANNKLEEINLCDVGVVASTSFIGNGKVGKSDSLIPIKPIKQGLNITYSTKYVANEWVELVPYVTGAAYGYHKADTLYLTSINGHGEIDTAGGLVNSRDRGITKIVMVDSLNINSGSFKGWKHLKEVELCMNTVPTQFLMDTTLQKINFRGTVSILDSTSIPGFVKGTYSGTYNWVNGKWVK